MSQTGRALLTATLTTVVALMTLTLASFDGFREFGVACALGVAVCLMAAVLVIPPMVGASERMRPSRRPQRAVSERAGVRWGLRVCRGSALVLVALGLLGVARSDQIQFEYDFGNLEAPKDPDRIKYGSALGRTRSSAPALMLGRDEAQMREVHAELSRRLRSNDPQLRGFTTIASGLPSAEQQRRRTGRC